MNCNFELFDKATIKKEYLKDGIKYLELTYYDEDINKLYVFNMSYKRYLLQKYLGYLIPSNHKIILLDKNEENFDICNLGIRDEYNESPVYKGYKEISKLFKKNSITKIRTKSPSQKKGALRHLHIYMYEKHIGRQLLDEETLIFIDGCKDNSDIKNLLLKRYSFVRRLNSQVYPSHFIIKGPYLTSGGSYIVKIKNNNNNTQFKLSYPKFLMQEHLGRLLEEDEIVEIKNKNKSIYPDNLNITKLKKLKSNVYSDTADIIGPYSNNTFCYVTIKFKNKSCRYIEYGKFLMQEHLGRLLEEDEYVIKKIPNAYDIANLELKQHPKLSSKLYKNVKTICGPFYDSEKNNFRLYVNIVNKNNHRFGISYPKFLMQEHLGRLLSMDETIHHKDGDFYNNEIDNLEILSLQEHITKDIRRLKPIKLKCPICGKLFELSGEQLKAAYQNKKLYRSGPFCSLMCSYKVNQHTKHKFINNLPEKKYYNLSGTLN